ncbi:hypothetical protein CCACVL1_22220 [Corchorus capsularis]|uniref:Uncharacterized protein n=1 Tax=Corchorus capsularis TaxID=210143 RepID=A0A1R3H0I8_COCAP|nr:hypothetical protein CCACVL1_22220 [Corchorus capsularis]
MANERRERSVERRTRQVLTTYFQKKRRRKLRRLFLTMVVLHVDRYDVTPSRING